MFAGATMCVHTEDAMELCSEYGLYLKPVAKILISIAMPSSHTTHSVKVLSNWEVMEKIRKLADPIQLVYLKVVKSTADFMRYEGEIDNASDLKKLIDLLDQKIIKLGGYLESFKIRAKESKTEVLTEASWNTFFEGWSESDETQPGLRPDTIYIESLPCRWFAIRDNQTDAEKTKAAIKIEESNSKSSVVLPDAEVVQRVFGRFGPVRVIDIPMLDPYRSDDDRRGIGTFSAFGPGTSGITFSAFVQYEDYSSFATAMEALGKHKLMYKPSSGSNAAPISSKSYVANIKVDFDRTGHLSEKQIMRRKIESMRLKQLEKEREEQKRREKEERETKAKAEQLAQLKPRTILLRAAEGAAQAERQRLKSERKMLRAELKEKDKKEKLLLEIEKKNASLQRLAADQAKFEYEQKLNARKKEALNLLQYLMDKIKDLRSQEIVERRLVELEAARVAELGKQRQLIAKLELQQMAEKERHQMLLQEHENNLRRKLLEKMSSGKTIKEEGSKWKPLPDAQNNSGSHSDSESSSDDSPSKNKISKTLFSAVCKQVDPSNTKRNNRSRSHSRNKRRRDSKSRSYRRSTSKKVSRKTSLTRSKRPSRSRKQRSHSDSSSCSSNSSRGI